jgi:hypothetical protein
MANGHFFGSSQLAAPFIRTAAGVEPENGVLILDASV